MTLNWRGAATIAGFVLAASGCASSATLRPQPLTAGDARVFRSPKAQVLGAMTQAFGETGIHLDSTENLDSTTTLLLGTHGMNLMSYGEIVRVAISPASSGATTVRVITARRLWTNVSSSGDWSDRLFAQVDRILDGWDSTGVAVRVPWTDSAAVEARSLVLAAIRPNNTIRIHGPAIGTLTGHLLGVQSGVLRWREAERPAVSVAAIDSIWIRKSHTTAGAIAGAFVGLAVGVVLQSQPAATLSQSYSRVWGGLLATVGGTLLGAIIGEAIPSWQRRWP